MCIFLTFFLDDGTVSMNIYFSKLLKLGVCTHTCIYFSKPSRLLVFVRFFLSSFPSSFPLM